MRVEKIRGDGSGSLGKEPISLTSMIFYISIDFSLFLGSHRYQRVCLTELKLEGRERLSWLRFLFDERRAESLDQFFVLKENKEYVF